MKKNMYALHVISLEFTENPRKFYRDLQGLYGEIGVQGFQIYGDCMYTRQCVIPSQLRAHYRVPRATRGFPTLFMGETFAV